MTAVRLRDIAPRLAFQAHPVETAIKIELVDRLTAAGVRAVEVSSFVNPKLVPGVADAAEVFARVRRPVGVSFECCVASASGLQRAIDAGADRAWFLLSADETFSWGNTGRSVADSLTELARLRDIAAKSTTQLGTYIIAVFGGPAGPARGPAEFAPIAGQLVAMDVRDWILADSCGYASPAQMRGMVAYAAGLAGLERLSVQVHDSRGMGLANIAALTELGIVNIDTALAGSGGHPAAPDALVGGTCTEDAVQMLDLLGIETGLDLAALIDAANWLDKIIGGKPLGFVRRSGLVPVTAEAVPLPTTGYFDRKAEAVRQ